MSARAFGSGYDAGNACLARLAGSRGLIHNLHTEAVPAEPLNPVLAWTRTPPDASQATASSIVRLWRDGALEKTVYGAVNRIGVAPVRTSGWVNYELEPVTACEDALPTDSSNYFSVYPQGDRAKLTWTECTAQDFGNYLLYWNGGGTATPATLLATIGGAENITQFSPQLTNGITYKFGLKLQDVLGNTTSIGTVVSVTADAPPKALESTTISFSAVTRKATLSGTHPVGQDTDLGAVYLYDNYLPGIGFDEYPNVDFPMRRGVSFATSGAVSITTPELSVGQWKFALRVVDRFGAQSDYQVFSLRLKATGSTGTLAVGSATPLAPVGCIAYGTSGANAVVRWIHDGANATKFKIFAAASVVGSVTAAASVGRIVTNPAIPLMNGVRYGFYAVAYNGSIASGSSNTSYCTMDGSAPAGAKALTANLVH